MAQQRHSETIDWSEEGQRWPTRIQLDFGDATELPGVRLESGDVAVPTAAVALPDGEYAILDPAKERILRLGSTGDYVGEWGGVAAASDLAWDPANARLVWAVGDSQGTLGEAELGAPAVSLVATRTPFARLTPTPWGVYARSSAFTLLPTPLSTSLSLTGDGAIDLPDGTALTVGREAENQVLIGREGRWTLSVTLEGVNGPAVPAADLGLDSLVYGDSYVSASLLGSSAAESFTHRLLIVEVDLRDGSVRRSELVEACLSEDELAPLSRIFVDYATGELSQLCISESGLEIRAGWDLG